MPFLASSFVSHIQQAVCGLSLLKICAWCAISILCLAICLRLFCCAPLNPISMSDQSEILLDAIGTFVWQHAPSSVVRLSKLSHFFSTLPMVKMLLGRDRAIAIDSAMRQTFPSVRSLPSVSPVFPYEQLYSGFQFCSRDLPLFWSPESTRSPAVCFRCCS